jgi:hypothetical protein
LLQLVRTVLQLQRQAYAEQLSLEATPSTRRRSTDATHEWQAIQQRWGGEVSELIAV